MANVFIACPTYGGVMSTPTARSIWGTATQAHTIFPVAEDFSLVPWNCNRHWCTALNNRQADQLQWFAMIHSDIAPEPWWLDKLITEAEAQNADLLSAVVPIKNQQGMTSTAILRPGGPFGAFHRLSLAQLFHPSFPQTFDIHMAVDALEKLPPELRVEGLPREALLVNTGLMVLRLDRPWANERIWFDDLNGIVRIDGKLQAVCKSEDWHFSHRVAQEGGRVMATTAIHLIHTGACAYPSHQVWGQPRER
jgi:hypothetical protein